VPDGAESTHIRGAVPEGTARKIPGRCVDVSSCMHHCKITADKSTRAFYKLKEKGIDYNNILDSSSIIMIASGGFLG
jgi:hypothetical protein